MAIMHMSTGMNPVNRSMIDDRTKLSKILQCGGFLILFSAIAIWFVGMEYSVAVLQRGAGEYQFARLTSQADRKEITTPDPDVLARSLIVQPLSPVVVNAAIFKLAHDAGSTALAVEKAALLKKLGWRHTVALQNRVYAAVRGRNILEIADIGDALLRRNVIVDEATALMNLMEEAPFTRKIVVAKLAKYPDWRVSYLERVYKMRDPRMIAARARLAEDLYKVKAGLDRAEIYPTVKIMVASGQTRAAYSLWRKYRRVEASQLNDPGFEWAWEMRSDQFADMPFEWRLANNAGYWAEVTRENNINSGKPALRLNWDLNGAPELLSQQLALTSRSNRLVITGRQLSSVILDRLRFSLNCPDGSQVFHEKVSFSDRRIVLGTSDPFRCNTPVFVVLGIPANGITSGAQSAFGGKSSFQVEISNVALIPIAATQSASGTTL